MFFAIKLKNLIFKIPALLFLVLILVYPAQSITAAKEGLNISLYLVLPSLFPFAVISSYIACNLTLPDFLCRIFSKISGISKSGAAPFYLGLLSGYPVGAILTADAVKSNILTKGEAEHLLPFCNACGPLFLIGVAGFGMFGGYEQGYFLYLVHISAVLLTMFILRVFAPKSEMNENFCVKPHKLTEILDMATNNILKVIAAIIFFSVVCEVVKKCGIFEIFLPVPAIGYGFLEITNGLNKLALSSLPPRITLSIASFLCGFSGLCIYLQVKSAVGGLNISTFKYLLYKLLIAVSAFILSYVLFPFFPLTSPTFAQGNALSPEFLSGSYSFLVISTIIFRLLRRTKVNFFDKR